MKYTIVGCITQYSIEDIKPYVESINKSGFSGEKLMLVYDVSQEVINYLDINGWLIAWSRLQEHIILQRFRDMYAVLHQYNTDIIIWTDVKDVIFQKNPIEWLDKWMRKDILAFSECIKLKDDPWACINSGTTFPMEWEFGMKEQLSYCAGIIVGKRNAIRDLFIDIYRWSKTTANPEQLSDQAAYNILLRLEHYKHSVDFVDQERGFVTQLGTVWCKREEFMGKLTEPTPSLEHDLFCSKSGEPFYVVHQYDRDPKLKQLIYQKYK
jgi:hypothetical protein